MGCSAALGPGCFTASASRPGQPGRNSSGLGTQWILHHDLHHFLLDSGPTGPSPMPPPSFAPPMVPTASEFISFKESCRQSYVGLFFLDLASRATRIPKGASRPLACVSGCRICGFGIVDYSECFSARHCPHHSRGPGLMTRRLSQPSRCSHLDWRLSKSLSYSIARGSQTRSPGDLPISAGRRRGVSLAVAERQL